MGSCGGYAVRSRRMREGGVCEDLPVAHRLWQSLHRLRGRSTRRGVEFSAHDEVFARYLCGHAKNMLEPPLEPLLVAPDASSVAS